MLVQPLPRHFSHPLLSPLTSAGTTEILFEGTIHFLNRFFVRQQCVNSFVLYETSEFPWQQPPKKVHCNNVVLHSLQSECTRTEYLNAIDRAQLERRCVPITSTTLLCICICDLRIIPSNGNLLQFCFCFMQCMCVSVSVIRTDKLLLYYVTVIWWTMTNTVVMK